MTARYLLAGQLRRLSEEGFRVSLVTSPGPDLDGIAEREGVEVETVPLSREIRPLQDLLSWLRLVRLFRRLRPDVVNAGTPKAGLLGMLAARAVGVPVRIYTLRGLRLETASGVKRRLLFWSERWACACAHRVLCVSESLRRRAVELGLVAEAKAAVPGAGSSNGVDVERFEAAAADRAQARALAGELGLPEGAPVIGFVGRFTRDKGIGELVEAFDRISAELPGTRLLLLGDFESGDPVPPQLARRLREDSRMVLPGFVPDTAPYYPLMDVLALPSYREGFPNAPLEAAAAGVPTVGYRATGVVDAVVDGRTGTLLPVGDVEALARGLLDYLRDPELRRSHGEAARERVRREFRREKVWEAWEDEIRALFRSRPGRAGSPGSAVGLK
jgi:glycosyltransferase involved in cell wall biosynthesis